MLTAKQTKMIRYYRDMMMEKKQQAMDDKNLELYKDIIHELMDINLELAKNGKQGYY